MSDLEPSKVAVASESVPPSAPKRVSAVEFFEDIPPGRRVVVEGIAHWRDGSTNAALKMPRLTLHCGSDKCGGLREFDSFSGDEHTSGTVLCFVQYRCRNCSTTKKTYATSMRVMARDNDAVYAMKYGEDPAFGPPTPARLTSLVGPEREYYLKGTRAENQGLGIAAFAYYRRVVENRKNAILAEVKRVAVQLGAPNELMQQLEAALKETQFSTAVEMVKQAIPPSLLINGHNPLTLLHSALSDGLHARTDDECLELATDIRIVLTDFVERVASALKDDAALLGAVARLTKKQSRLVP